jgi:hypothetical protein
MYRCSAALQDIVADAGLLSRQAVRLLLQNFIWLAMQAVASNSRSLVPAISLNGLIRYRDDFKQRMDDLRIYRQLRREEDLLQKYGMVPQQHAACCQNHSVREPHDVI